MKKAIAALLGLAMLICALPAQADVSLNDPLYLKGSAAYNRGDYAEAFEYLLKPAEQGHALAQYMLGVMCFYGQGTELSYEQAFMWLERSAKQGNINAKASLGWCYEYGFGVEPDIDAAAKLYMEAAERRNIFGAFNLARLYLVGEGVPQDYQKALEGFEYVARMTQAPEAQTLIGAIHAGGLGVEQSWEQAAQWYKKAAQQGNADAQYNLGMLYENGSGVEQSFEQAAYWYGLAAQQGHEDAGERLSKLNSMSTGAQDDAAREEIRAENLSRACDRLKAFGFDIDDDDVSMTKSQLDWMYSHRILKDEFWDSFLEDYDKESNIAGTLLYVAGMGRFDDEAEFGWVPSSGTVYAFDMEVYDVEFMYTLFLMGVQSIVPDVEITDIREDISGMTFEDFDESNGVPTNGTRSISFKCNGHEYSLELVSYLDWFNPEMLEFMDQVLEKEGCPKCLQALPDFGQTIVLIYDTQARAEEIGKYLLGN